MRLAFKIFINLPTVEWHFEIRLSIHGVLLVSFLTAQNNLLKVVRCGFSQVRAKDKR